MAKKKEPTAHKLSMQTKIDESKTTQPSTDAYVSAEKEKELVSAIFYKFRQTAELRDATYRYLGDRNITEYIDDAVYRFISNMDTREGIEEWQARVNVPMTHNKVSTILGKIVAMLPMAEIVSRNGSNPKLVKYLDNLYQYAEDVDDYDELMICAVLEAIVKGTVVGEECYEYCERTVRDITGYHDDMTPIYQKKTIKESKLSGVVVPLEQFYPSSIAIRRLEDQPYAFRRYTIPYAQFVADFEYLPRYIHVSPKSNKTASTVGANTTYNQDLISNDVGEGEVEIIKYYNKISDEYICMANGVWLNPMTDWTVAPLPYNHKRLPFWSARFDTFGADFFYGRSLVDRLQSLQDVLNILTNMALDQSFLTIFPPILTNGIDPIEDDYLRPGRRVPVDTQGLPLNQSFMKLDIGTPGGWHQWMLEYVKTTMEQASVDQVASGQAGVGGRTTAEEIRQAASGVAAILGVFGKLLNNGIKNKALLKASNIAQFWTNKNTPIVSRVTGEDGNVLAEAFNVITLNNARLSDGRIGNKVIGMYGSTAEMPAKGELATQALLDEAATGTPTEIHAITGAVIRGLEMDVRFVPNRRSEDTKEIQKALVLEKAKTYMSLFPDTTNKTELQNDIAEVFGDDPAKMFAEQKQAPQPQAPQAGQAPTPNPDVANNMMRGMMGGEVDAMQMRDLGLSNQM